MVSKTVSTKTSSCDRFRAMFVYATCAMVKQELYIWTDELITSLMHRTIYRPVARGVDESTPAPLPVEQKALQFEQLFTKCIRMLFSVKY